MEPEDQPDKAKAGQILQRMLNAGSCKELDRALHARSRARLAWSAQAVLKGRVCDADGTQGECPEVSSFGGRVALCHAGHRLCVRARNCTWVEECMLLALALAARAIVRAARANHGAHDGGGARGAGLAFTRINAPFVLELAILAVGRDEVTDAAAARLDRALEHLL